MQKIHLLLKKEDLSEAKLETGSKIAVVLDVLLATTTITSALEDGAKEVIPVMDSEEALETAKKFNSTHCVVAGELNAKPLDGFVYPSPSLIRKMVKDKTLILSTTNGTVALRKAAAAKKVFIASLVNNPFVAGAVRQEKADTIVVVCSGNSSGFSLEDFYGAGHFIDCLLGNNQKQFELTDSALAALLFYQGNKERSKEILASSLVGRMFNRNEGELELQFASQKGTINRIPVLENGKVVCAGVSFV
jgi:2-phosphosulfolactate phosphatase